MPRNRVAYYPPQTINEVWEGVGSSGFIPGSGGSSSIVDLTHDLSNLGHGDCGGPMVLHRQQRSYQLGSCFDGQGKGSQVAIHPAYFRGGADEPLNSSLYGLGGTAIARTIPTNPAVDVADIFAQSINYRQALPKAAGASLWKQRALGFKALNPKTFANEYLNWEFGWLPFVQDIRDVCHAVVHSHEYLKKLQAGSDHKTRAGYRFPQSISYPTSGAPAFVYSRNSSLSGWWTGPISYSCEVGTDTWFKGCYTYHVPVDPERMSNLDKFSQYAQHVLGLRPTLENVWDASPWSWAVDWYANVGDVAHNISAFSRDGLILQYGYIMCHTWVRELWFAGTGTNCTSCSTTALSEWKVRYPASPYGFGLTYEGLSDSQKAILASIGITHFL